MRVPRPLSIALLALAGAAALPVATASAEPPRCEPISLQTRGDRPLELYGSCSQSQPDGDVTWQIARAPEHGTVEQPYGEAGSLMTYTPAPGFQGTDTFAYRATSPSGPGAPAEVTITVDPASNQAPTCFETQPIRTRPNRSSERAVTCHDADGDLVTLRVAPDGTGPAHGTVAFTRPPDASFNTTVLTYTTGPLYTGPDGIDLLASDGRTEVAVATIPVEIVPDAVNTAPTCYDLPLWASSGWTTGIGFLCEDPEGDPYTFAFPTPPSHGTARGVERDGRPTLEYKSVRGYVGPDRFTYTASDGRATSEPRTIDVTVVDNGPAPPDCSPEPNLQVLRNLPRVIDAHCTSEEGPVVYSLAQPPEHGRVIIAHPNWPPIYVPDRGYVGPDSFGFIAATENGPGVWHTQTLQVVRRLR